MCDRLHVFAQPVVLVFVGAIATLTRLPTQPFVEVRLVAFGIFQL